ncbi:hypothetical protein [Stenotrophomonas rhizophila]|uniref:hypothetical protein n=1 Tax=Stenotrophomonas rhizophila TaxID=216778 RepID=UPI001E521180|nr:hypothetical protein [Stenotrophomonas rhizophila]MCC7634542.1 hypothetical protein [Stenotrophomonas rhizophila]MCC7664189.1 hypothetical protein [Stenotrophomonas rhizophila]
MSGEVIFVRFFKGVLVLGAVYIFIGLARFMVEMTCPLNGYPAVVMWGWLLALVALLAYTKIDFMSVGLFGVSLLTVRVIAGSVSAAVAALAVLVGIWNADCEVSPGVVVFPAALLIFYAAFVIALLFGDRYLGVLRKIVRLGIKPFDPSRVS